ncbi:MAG: Chromate resistance protein ChrB, partial [Acidimicrobiia bacterium]
MAAGLKWVFLVYRLPRDPSTPRIALWRRLRRLGVVQVADGVVALPLDARTKEQLEWAADEVVEAGGEASLWIAEAGSAAQERALAERMAGAVAQEYVAVMAAAEEAAGQPPASRR